MTTNTDRTIAVAILSEYSTTIRGIVKDNGLLNPNGTPSEGNTMRWLLSTNFEMIPAHIVIATRQLLAMCEHLFGTNDSKVTMTTDTAIQSAVVKLIANGDIQ